MGIRYTMVYRTVYHGLPRSTIFLDKFKFINGHERHANVFARLSDCVGEAKFELVSEIPR